MRLRIESSDSAVRRFLEMTPKGVTFTESVLFGGSRSFAFNEIVCLLLADDGLLAFQVGREVFSVWYDRTKPKEQQVVAALVAGLQAAAS